MKVLVVGSGGREHALVWKISQSSRVTKIYCAPGNAGIKGMAECVDIAATDIDALLQFAKNDHIDLTIVGPESSLAAGIVDLFEKNGLRIFGPRKNAAILEGSKVYAKEFMEKYAIPTASFKIFDDLKKAKKYINQIGAPLVVKADGLAAGKGVIVAGSIKEAKDAVELIMQDRAFGDAGNKVVIEACLQGEEASFIAFTDGKTILPLPTSQDHKAIYDGDKGPNTGGMGAYSPAPVVTEAIADYVMNKVMLPTIQGMAAEGRPLKGMLYAGLMIAGDKINVLEFNCRFGDPEAQPLLMRLKSDVVDIFEAAIDGTLDLIEMKIDPRPTVCVVMSSGGYPGKYEEGKIIKGLARAVRESGVQIFHAGTARKNGRIVTAGGRVLGVTAVGKSLEKAIEQAYKAVDCIHWTGCYSRRDIGAKALRRSEQLGTQVTDRSALMTQQAEIEAAVLVGIIMDSKTDLLVMQAAADFFKKMSIPYEMKVASVHIASERLIHWASTAQQRGIKVIIAGAGICSPLAAIISAHTELPVIGVPCEDSLRPGMNALLAMAQVPSGMPVATMAIGQIGAKNGAVLAARILALQDKEIATQLQAFNLEIIRELEEQAGHIEG